MRWFVLIVLAGVFLVSCDPASNPENVRPTTSSGDITDYGNGVYYFDYTNNAFGNKLSAYLEAHPDLELVEIAPNGTSGYGADDGYFVIFRDAECCKCSGTGVDTTSP